MAAATAAATPAVAAAAAAAGAAQLWLCGNPLQTLPASIEKCAKLRVLDLRDTKLVRLPRELSRLSRVVEIDTRGTPLKPKLRAAVTEGGTMGLLGFLKQRDVLKQLKLDMSMKLRSGIYREVAEAPEGRAAIVALIKVRAAPLLPADLRATPSVLFSRLAPASNAVAPLGCGPVPRVRTLLGPRHRLLQRRRRCHRSRRAGRLQGIWA